MKTYMKTTCRLLLVLTLPCWAYAQSTDADFQPLLKERKFQEVEALANARITKNPSDELAIWYLTSVSANDKIKRETTITMQKRALRRYRNPPNVIMRWADFTEPPPYPRVRWI